MDAASSRADSLRGLPARIGELLVAPRGAMARIDREGGGLNDSLWLVAIGALAFRFAAVAEALMGLAEPSLDTFMRLASVFAREAQGAAWVVLPAAVLVTALAGARRDASRDLELGAACYAPYFAVTAVARALDAVAGRAVVPALVGEIVGGAAALVALGSGLAVARARGATPKDAPPVTPATARRSAVARSAFVRPAFGAGLAVLAVAAIGLASNGAWSARHLSALKPLSHGQPAPDFRLPRADGTPGTLALSELRGRVVVLDFWATWCPPCLAMMPTVHELDHEWRARGVSFVGVNSDGGIDPAALQEFVASHGISYPVVLDEGDAGGLYKVRSLPTMVIVGKDGAIRRTFLGFTSKGSIESALQEAVAAAP
jgi:thiol-disulfide isomerase/thioredoxin